MKNKNIFILPTTEPSQVYLAKRTNALSYTSKDPESMEHYGSGTHNQHIYITNKDLYKKGGWCIDIEDGYVFKVEEIKEFSGIVRSATDTYVYDACEKIILTSDPKLVTQGITEIDTEFLILLKGKKLDEINIVEIEKTPLLSNNSRALYGYQYKPIILPNESKKHIVILAGQDAVKEENNYNLKQEIIAEMEKIESEELEELLQPKPYQQDLFNYLHSEFNVIALQSEMKEIENIVNQMPFKNVYSEEDMREMYNKSCGLVGLGKLNDQTENNNRFIELIEKFKNK